MGWTSYNDIKTKRELIQKVINDFDKSGYTVLKHKSTSQGLYAAVIHPNGNKFLYCAKIQRHNKEISIKEMEESMGPTITDCPPSLFKLVGKAPNEYAQQFRERCIRSAEIKKIKRQWQPSSGEKVVIGDNSYLIESKYSDKYYKVKCLTTNQLFRSTKKEMFPVKLINKVN